MTCPRQRPCRPRRFRPLPPPIPHMPFSLRPGSFSPISSAAGQSTPGRYAPRWRRPSAPPMPRAHGTGKPPTTPARRRPYFSCANTEERFSAKPALRPPPCRCWLRSPAFSLLTRAVPPRARPFSSSRRRSRLALPHRSPPPSRQQTACWSRRSAQACSRFLPRSQAQNSC